VRTGDHLKRKPAEHETALLRASVGTPIGRFHVAGQRDHRPVELSAWRITTEDHLLADTLAALYGGERNTSDADGFGHEVLTRRDAIPVVLNAGLSVTLRMVQQGAGDSFHTCDGGKFLEPTVVAGQPCGCASTLAERKAAARTGRGPRPEVDLQFCLADLPAAGRFHLVVTSWEFADSVRSLEQAVAEVGGPAVCVLRHQRVEFATRSGIEVSYRKPVIDVVGRAEGGKDSVNLAA
jgi:hypothetical protein